MGGPRLAHVAVLVRDLDAQTVVPASTLRLAVRQRITVSEEGVAVSFIAVGRADIELVQPLTGDGALSRFLVERGEGLHHVAVRVPDLETAISRAAAAGLRLAGPAPRPGAHGTRVAFIHPSTLCGLLLELVEEREVVSA